jgi:hypothetical protein
MKGTHIELRPTRHVWSRLCPPVSLSHFRYNLPSISLSPRGARVAAMRFPQTLAFLILAMAFVFALPAWAQRKPVAPTFRSVRADVAASLPRHVPDGTWPRHGGVKPPLRRADLKVSATTSGERPSRSVCSRTICRSEGDYNGGATVTAFVTAGCSSDGEPTANSSWELFVI